MLVILIVQSGRLVHIPVSMPLVCCKCELAYKLTLSLTGGSHFSQRRRKQREIQPSPSRSLVKDGVQDPAPPCLHHHPPDSDHPADIAGTGRKPSRSRLPTTKGRTSGRSHWDGHINGMRDKTVATTVTTLYFPMQLLILTIMQVDASIEFLLLSFLAVYIILKLIWFGPRQFITSKTTVFNVSTLNQHYSARLVDQTPSDGITSTGKRACWCCNTPIAAWGRERSGPWDYIRQCMGCQL